MLNGEPWPAATAPTANSSESPGKNGVTTKSGLAEDDGEQQQIEPRPHRPCHVVEMGLTMEDVLQQLTYIHEIPERGPLPDAVP